MFLKRAGWSLWRHKFRNVLILLVFSAILAVTLTSFMVYAGTSYQVEVTQKAVANALTLTGLTLNGRGSTMGMDVYWSDADRFVKGPHVERYNIVMNNVDMDAEGLVPSGLSEHERELYQKYQKELGKYDIDHWVMVERWASAAANRAGLGEGDRYDVTPDEEGNYTYDIYLAELTPEENAENLELFNLLYCRELNGERVPEGFKTTVVSDSEYFDAFSGGGYSLVEGRHFKSEEEDKPTIVVSRAMAEASGVKVGDKVQLEFGNFVKNMATFYKNDPWEVEVVGLFDPPVNDILADVGYQAAAENIIFVPYQALMDYLKYLYNDGTLLWFPSIERATAYIDEPENVDEFIQWAYDQFRLVETDPETGIAVGTSIEDVLDEGTFGTDDPDEVDAKFMQFMMDQSTLSTWYSLSVDRNWYDMVASPMESVNRLSLFMGIGLLAGAFVALLLVCIFNVRARRREVGVLLAMGESKGKVFAQLFLEQALPLVLAAAVGFACGVPLARSLGNSLLEGRATQVNAAYEQDKREYLREQMGGNPLSLDNSMTMRSAANVASPVKMQFTLDTALAWGYFALAFGMLFLTVLIQSVFLLRLSPAKIMSRRN